MKGTRELRKRPRDHDRNTRSQESKEGSSSDKPDYNETLTRPKWDPAVRKRIFDAAEDPNDSELYVCAYSGNSYPREEMQIDHIENWADWCMRYADTDNPQEMYVQYNNTANLQLLHKSVNASKGKGKSRIT